MCQSRLPYGMLLQDPDPSARGESTASMGDEIKKFPTFSCHWESKGLSVTQLEFVGQIYW